jgi:hypothetical protein
MPRQELLRSPTKAPTKSPTKSPKKSPLRWAAENKWLGHNSEIIDDFWKWAKWYHVIIRLEDCENVSIEERSALNKLQIFHRCLCYKNSRYK